MDARPLPSVPSFPKDSPLASFPEWYKRKWLPFVAKCGFIWACHELVSDIPRVVPPVENAGDSPARARGRSARTRDPESVSEYEKFVDDYGEDVSTPGSFRWSNIRLLGALVEALEHHHELCEHAASTPSRFPKSCALRAAA